MDIAKILIAIISAIAGFITPAYFIGIYSPQIVWTSGYGIPDGVYIATLSDGSITLSRAFPLRVGPAVFINFRPLMPGDVVFFYSIVCPASINFYSDAIARVMKDLNIRSIYVVSCENLFLGAEGCTTRASKMMVDLISKDGIVLSVPEILLLTREQPKLFTDFINEKLSQDPSYTRSRQLWQAIEEFITTYTGNR